MTAAKKKSWDAVLLILIVCSAHVKDPLRDGLLDSDSAKSVSWPHHPTLSHNAAGVQPVGKSRNLVSGSLSFLKSFVFDRAPDLSPLVAKTLPAEIDGLVSPHENESGVATQDSPPLFDVFDWQILDQFQTQYSESGSLDYAQDLFDVDKDISTARQPLSPEMMRKENASIDDYNPNYLSATTSAEQKALEDDIAFRQQSTREMRQNHVAELMSRCNATTQRYLHSPAGDLFRDACNSSSSHGNPELSERGSLAIPCPMEEDTVEPNYLDLDAVIQMLPSNNDPVSNMSVSPTECMEQLGGCDFDLSLQEMYPEGMDVPDLAVTSSTDVDTMTDLDIKHEELEEMIDSQSFFSALDEVDQKPSTSTSVNHPQVTFIDQQSSTNDILQRAMEAAELTESDAIRPTVKGKVLIEVYSHNEQGLISHSVGVAEINKYQTILDNANVPILVHELTRLDSKAYEEYLKIKSDSQRMAIRDVRKKILNMIIARGNRAKKLSQEKSLAAGAMNVKHDRDQLKNALASEVVAGAQLQREFESHRGEMHRLYNVEIEADEHAPSRVVVVQDGVRIDFNQFFKFTA